MQHGYSVAAIIPVFNEEGKLGDVIRRIPRPLIDEILVVDDGSTDRSAQIAQQYGTTLLSMEQTTGVGAALRAGYGLLWSTQAMTLRSWWLATTRMRQKKCPYF